MFARWGPERGDGEVRAAFKGIGFGVPLARESRVSDQIRDALEAILLARIPRGTTLSEADHVLATRLHVDAHVRADPVEEGA